MARKGWKNYDRNQSKRHSNAKKYGVAGGLYAKPKKRYKTYLEPVMRHKIDFDGDGVPDKYDCEPLNPKKQDKLWTIGKGLSVETRSESTRSGFRHIAILYKDGVEIDRTKVTYQNRTWESYQFETALKKLAEQSKYVLDVKEQKKFKDMIVGGRGL